MQSESDYKTTSTSSGTMDISPIELRKTTTTMMRFEPYWVEESDNPLRGSFRFYRKSKNDSWEEIDSKPMNALHKDEEYSLRLTGEETTKLISELDKLTKSLNKLGHSFGERQFTVNEINAESILLQIGKIENRKMVIKQLKNLEKDNFENLGLAIGNARLQKMIEIIESNLGASKNEEFWQGLFEENPWVLQQMFTFPVIFLNGETFLGGKNSKGRQGSGGSATDFLFKNGSNGSFAVLELKTPDSQLVGQLYRGVQNSGDKNELYQIHGNLSGGIVQMENQIHIAIEHFEKQIGADYKELNHLDPTGVLITGNYSLLDNRQKISFDLFRKSLGKNQIYTFDEVLEKLKLLKSVYE